MKLLIDSVRTGLKSGDKMVFDRTTGELSFWRGKDTIQFIIGVTTTSTVIVTSRGVSRYLQDIILDNLKILVGALANLDVEPIKDNEGVVVYQIS